MTTIVGKDNIEVVRLITLKHMLSLEMKGLGRHGRSAYSIVKEELGFRGNRQRVYDQLKEYLALLVCPNCGKRMPDNPAFRALSRKDNETEICPSCGTNEALGEV